MVGTTTKATSRQVTTSSNVNPATQAAILAAAAVAQVIHTIEEPGCFYETNIININ